MVPMPEAIDRKPWHPRARGADAVMSIRAKLARVTADVDRNERTARDTTF